MGIDGYTTIHRTTDLAQGELLAEMLRREGIDARFHQVSSTLIGLPASMIEMSVDVPAASEARARQLIADLEYAGAAEALDREEGGGAAAAESKDEDDDERDAASTGPDASRLPALSRRRPIFAAGFAVFLPGGAHLYARRAWTALVLAAGVAGCLAVVVTTRSGLVFEFAFAMLAAIVACDAIAGVRAARAEARGERPSRARQLARGLALLGLAIVAGGGGRFATAAPRVMRTWQLARYRVTCTDRSIVVENQDGRAHGVEIANLKIVALSLVGREDYSVGIKGRSYLDVGPNDRGMVTPDVADWLSRSCGFPSVPEPPRAAAFAIQGFETPQMPPPRSMRCGFSFSFSAGGDDAAPTGAVGFCVPPQSPGQTGVGKLDPLR